MARTQAQIGLIAETLLSASSDARSSLEAVNTAGLLEGNVCYAVDKKASYGLRPADTQTPDGDKVVAASAGGNWVLEDGGSDPVEVRTLGDLPAPVGGIITLPNDTNYLFVGLVNLGPNRIQMGQNCSLYGLGCNLGSTEAAASIVGSNTSSLVSLYSGITNSSIEGLCIRNAAGPALGWASGEGYVRVFNCCLLTDIAGPVAVLVGAVTSPDLDVMQTKLMPSTGAGAISLSLSGVWSTVRLCDCTLGYGDGVVIAASATINEILVNGCRFTMDGLGYTGIVQTDADPGTILVGGSITGNVFRGAGTAVDANVTGGGQWIGRGNIALGDF